MLQLSRDAAFHAVRFSIRKQKIEREARERRVDQRNATRFSSRIRTMNAHFRTGGQRG
jgi:hypothetical protein